MQLHTDCGPTGKNQMIGSISRLSNRMFTAAALRHGEGEFENKKSAYSVSLR